MLEVGSTTGKEPRRTHRPAGLLVGGEVLEAAETLVTRWKPSQVWGMSPFGGSTTEAVWERFDPRIFLRHSAPATRVQAAFRSAYALPRVVAVGTDSVEHLRELVGALRRARRH